MYYLRKSVFEPLPYILTKCSKSEKSLNITYTSTATKMTVKLHAYIPHYVLEYQTSTCRS